MQDLKNILASREDFYSKAQYQLDTSSKPLEPTFKDLRDLVRDLLDHPRPDLPRIQESLDELRRTIRAVVDNPTRTAGLGANVAARAGGSALTGFVAATGGAGREGARPARSRAAAA